MLNYQRLSPIAPFLSTDFFVSFSLRGVGATQSIASQVEHDVQQRTGMASRKHLRKEGLQGAQWHDVNPTGSTGDPKVRPCLSLSSVDPLCGFCSSRSSVFWLMVSTPLKHISQLGGLIPIYGKINNVQTTNQFLSRVPMEHDLSLTCSSRSVTPSCESVTI